MATFDQNCTKEWIYPSYSFIERLFCFENIILSEYMRINTYFHLLILEKNNFNYKILKHHVEWKAKEKISGVYEIPTIAPDHRLISFYLATNLNIGLIIYVLETRNWKLRELSNIPKCSHLRSEKPRVQIGTN